MKNEVNAIGEDQYTCYFSPFSANS